MKICYDCVHWSVDVCGLMADCVAYSRWEPAHPMPLPDGADVCLFSLHRRPQPVAGWQGETDAEYLTRLVEEAREDK